MSPSSPRRPPADSALRATTRLLVMLGERIREERRRRRWTLHDLAQLARLSPATVQSIEAGNAGSLEAAIRLSDALGLRLEFELVDPRKRQSSSAAVRYVDPVDAAMGEFEAGHLRPYQVKLAIDEPYQHYQFAGRADLVAWDLDARALLHIENRTRFPDFQDMAGAFNAKRAYLGQVLAERVGVKAWASETHVIVALWSAEVLHALRLRTESFRVLCPDDAAGFASWWSGRPPTSGRRCELIVLDPLATGRQRSYLALDDALTARPRYSGYAHAAEAIARGV